MVVLENSVKVKWNSKNKKHYESIMHNDKQKYTFTKVGEEFDVEVDDLPLHSKIKVTVICGICNSKVSKDYANYRKEISKSSIVCCRGCTGKRTMIKLGTIDNEYIKDETVLKSVKSKEDLVKEFYNYLDEFGVYPTLQDLKKNKNYSGASVYNRLYGNYKNFINELNVMGKSGWYKCDEIHFKIAYLRGLPLYRINDSLMIKRGLLEMMEKAKEMNLSSRELIRHVDYKGCENESGLILALTDLYEELGKIPTVADYEYYLKINNLKDRKKLERFKQKSYSKICQELFNTSNKTMKSDDDLLEELVDLKNKLGRTPLAIELSEYGLSDMKTYVRRFGMKYNELILSLGWELSSSLLHYKSDDELLADFESMYFELKRIPTVEDFDKVDVASHKTYLKRFGSIENILNILEIPLYANQDISLGFVCYNLRNELCRSHQELCISNLLIKNNIEYTPEYHYNSITNNLINRWRMDWFLNEYGICVEYFGMYNKSHLDRNTRLGKYSRKVKKKINHCDENNIKLISLYKEDLNNNFEGLLFKFKEFNIDLKIIE